MDSAATKTTAQRRTIPGSVKKYGELVMFPHTLFSLPFGITATLMAAGGFPRPWLVLWILVALVGARTGANALNRLIDRDIDAKNPRTAERHMPRGSVSAREAITLSACCFAALILAAFMIRPVCVFLLPVPLTLMLVYSFTKRFTWGCHLILGAACACAPLGAWLAVTGDIGWPAVSLGAAVMLWVAGFDIIYGALDERHDREQGLHSIPADFGTRKAFAVSAAFHAAAAALLALAGALCALGVIYYIGIIIIAGLLLYEHMMISPGSHKNIRIASYVMNEIVSAVFLLCSGADILIN